MQCYSKLGRTLLCAVSTLPLSIIAANAQVLEQRVETVTVTGSRVIADATQSPTPLTIVSIEQLQATTPTTIPDALNKLPIFQSSTTVRSNNNASQNSAGNVLNLRSFGSQRTLILLDGHRVAPSNANGTVDIDILPSMLMQRVDVVTGGASAVYGSDAVTGVVNFVLDKNFIGLKVDANSGISAYGDGGSFKLGIAGGMPLFEGHGHLLGSLQYYHADNIKSTARIEGRQVWTLTGLGTAANPFKNNINARLSLFSSGGKIVCSGGCTVSGQQFIADGIIGPFTNGTITGTNNVQSGGDGSYTTPSELNVMLTTKEAFGRFSYEFDDQTSIWVQATGAESLNKGGFQNNYLQSNPNVPNIFYKNNPYLTPTAQTQLGNNGLSNSTNTFRVYKYITNQGVRGTFETDGIDRNLQISGGANGKTWGGFDWDVYFTHGESRVEVFNPNNQNNQKMFPALDAVLLPGGSAVCYASQAANVGAMIAARYADCKPINPFGPTALTGEQYDYFTEKSQFIMTNVMDDIGATVSGEIFKGFGAGPVRAAVSGEYRTLVYSVASNALPTDTIDCTGLRLCDATAPFWQANVAQNRPPVNNSVYEFALEADVPLLENLPLVQSLSTNIAGRYTDYSTSGAVQTWKLGLDWHLNDEIRFRATNSVDIRAPTLNDLFSPQQITAAGFSDVHTNNTNNTVRSSSEGNPYLVPEVARTYTAGVVYTSKWISNLTLSLDYYTIALKNAISTVSAISNTTQNLCEASGGTSIFCDLYVRPLPFSNTTPANYPTLIKSLSLNATASKMEGWDLEANYGFDGQDLFDWLPGSFTIRSLMNYQPVNQSVSLPGTPTQWRDVSKVHMSNFFGYSVGEWRFNVQHRYLSEYNRQTTAGQVWTEQYSPSRNYFDFNITRKVTFETGTMDAYLSVQNVFDVRPPITPTNIANPGIYYLGAGARDYDGVGRYFTVGVRARL